MTLQTRARKILRDILAHRGRTFLVSFSIFVGVLGVVTLTSGANILLNTLDEDLVPAELPMAAVFLDTDDPIAPDDNAALLTLLNERPGVTVAEGIVFRTMYWKRPADDTFISGEMRANSAGFAATQLEPFDVIDGRLPADGANEVVIERRMADRYELDVGDEIDMRILSAVVDQADTSNIPEERWTVVGIVFDPYNYFESDQTVYATMDAARRVTGALGFGRIYLRYTTFTAAVNDVEAVAAAIEQASTYFETGTNTQDPHDTELVNEAKDWANTVVYLGIVAMLVASFLVVTVISTIVAEQRGQIGVMKSLGATMFDNFLIYAGMALVYGAMGLVPGVLLGIVAGNWLAAETSPLLGVYISGFAVSWSSVLVGIGLGLAVPVLAAVLPVAMGTRVTIIEAMTDLGIQSNFGRGFFSRMLGRLPLSFSARQGLISIYQKRYRLVLTGLTLTLATGSFMGVTSLFMALQTAIDDIYRTWNLHSGVFVVQSDNELDDIITLIEGNMDDVVATYPVSGARVDFDRSDGGIEVVFLRAIDPSTDVIRFNLAEGRLWDDPNTDSGIVITEGLADELGRGVGDTVVASYRGIMFEFEIIGLDEYPFNTAWVSMPAFFAATNGLVKPDGLYIRFADADITAAEVDQRNGDMRELLLANGTVPSFFNQVAEQEADATTITTVGLIFNIASAVMGLIGAAGLLVMLSISVFERQREIGVLRSIGANSSSIVWQFLVEGVLVGLLAWIAGIPLAFALFEVLKGALPVGDFAGAFEPVALVMGLVGVVLLSMVSSIGPSLSAARKTVADILRYA